MEVTSIQNGIIIDHVPAGTALKVLEYLKIDPSKTRLALIMNADSHLYDAKDIIKIEDRGKRRSRRARPGRPSGHRRHRARRQDRPQARSPRCRNTW